MATWLKNMAETVVSAAALAVAGTLMIGFVNHLMGWKEVSYLTYFVGFWSGAVVCWEKR